MCKNYDGDIILDNVTLINVISSQLFFQQKVTKKKENQALHLFSEAWQNTDRELKKADTSHGNGKMVNIPKWLQMVNIPKI